MIVVMLISLYSSRIVLKALGVDDFGLYNVIGGVVALFSFLRSSLTSSTQRFLSFELGKGNGERLKKVFSVSVTTHVLVSLVILLLSESLGLWFLNSKVNIPVGREFAANIIYQLSVFSLLVGMVTVPYNADVISHEKMGFFAIVGIFEAMLKLLFAFLLLVYGEDKLIVYGIFMAILNVLILLSYMVYCQIRFEETKFKFIFEKQLFKEIFSFSSWTILGQMAVITVNYGTSILLNIFYSVAANAAMGIAQQVNGALSGLTSNFQTAFQPQITKSYASRNLSYMNDLIYYSSKISFFLLFIVTFPVIMNIDAILFFWLTSVPQFTNSFCVLFIVASIFNAISAPLWISIFATGRIKAYQIVVSVVFFLDLFFVYGLFVLGFPPVTCMVVKVVINFVVIFVRLYYTSKEVDGFTPILYIKNALLPCFLSAAFTVLPVIFASFYINSVGGRIILTIFGLLLSIVIGYLVGLNTKERLMVQKYAYKLFHK